MSSRFKEAFDSLRSDDKLKRERIERVISAKNADTRKAATSSAENKSSSKLFFRSRRGIALLTAMAVFISAAAITLPVLISNGTLFNGFPGRSTAITRQFQAEIGKQQTNGYKLNVTSNVTALGSTLKVEEALSFNQGSNDFDFSISSGAPVDSYSYLFAREGYLFSDETTSPRTSGFGGVTLNYLGGNASSPLKNLDLSEIIPLENFNGLNESLSDTEDFSSEIKALLAFGDFMGCVKVNGNVSTIDFQKMLYYFAHDFYDISKTIDENTTYEDLRKNITERRYREFFAKNYPGNDFFEFFHEFLTILGSDNRSKLIARLTAVFGNNWKENLDKMLKNTTETKFEVKTAQITYTVTDLICAVTLDKTKAITVTMSGNVKTTASRSDQNVNVGLSMDLAASIDPILLTDLSRANVYVSALSDERLNSSGNGLTGTLSIPRFTPANAYSSFDTYNSDGMNETLTVEYVECDAENVYELILRKKTTIYIDSSHSSSETTYLSCTVQEGNIITVPVGDEERSYHLVFSEGEEISYLNFYAIGEGGVETQVYEARLSNHKSYHYLCAFNNCEFIGMNIEYTDFSVVDGELVSEKVLLNTEYSPETHVLSFDNGYGEQLRWKMEIIEEGDPMLKRTLRISGYDANDPEVRTFYIGLTVVYQPTPTPLYEALALIKNYNESIT